MSIYFNNREGQTTLSKNELKGLRLSHITNLRELNEAEQVNINQGLLWLSENNKNPLDEKFMQRLHKELFGEVWSWAGKYRTSEKNIGIDHWKIASEMHKLCDDTQYWLENETYTWIELIARFHHRLVSIHPFANGNGRFARILTNELCRKNGKETISWGACLPADERRHTYIAALQAADVKKFDKLIGFLKL